MSYGKVPQVGDQIVYLSRGDRTPEAEKEFGFVTTIAEDGTMYCRFWAKGTHGEKISKALRTLANSEGCSLSSLQFCDIGRGRDVDVICAAFSWGRHVDIGKPKVAS